MADARFISGSGDPTTRRRGALRLGATQVADVTSTLDSLNTAVGGLTLGGIIPVGLLLNIPTLPAQLGGFACP